jgi:hypothetical protein
MKIEATGKSLIYRWPGGEVHLEPGKPIDLPDERAKRLLMKAGTKARMVLSPVQLGDRIEWLRGDAVQQGTVDFVHVDVDGIAWAFVTIRGSWAAVNLKFVKMIDARTEPGIHGTEVPSVP